MVQILLGGGKYTIIDPEDFPRVSGMRWRYLNGYAHNHEVGYMHRFLLGVPKGMVVDHKNQVKLDNRRANLRRCKHAENIQAAASWKHNTSGQRNVYWHKASKKWMVRFKAFGQDHYLGLYRVKKDAITVAALAARRLFGDFCNEQSYRG